MTELILPPYTQLETERIILRRVTMEDVVEIFNLRTNKEAMKFIKKPELKSLDDARDLIKIMNEENRIQWGITLKNEKKIIGSIGFHRFIKEHYRAEIGYMLDPTYWNKGIMSEAIAKVIDFGFNKIKLHSIEAIIDPENIASRMTLEKFNFIKEAYFKENFFFEGEFFDSEVYSLLNK